MFRRYFELLAVSSLVWACHTTPIESPKIPPISVTASPTPGPFDYTQGPLTSASGLRLKKRVAVARFRDNIPVEQSPFGQKREVDVVTPNVHVHHEEILNEEGFVPSEFTERLTDALGRTERFVLVERKDINKVLRELNFDETKWVDKKKSAQIGKVLGAQVIITGSLVLNEESATRNQRPLSLLMRMYDVETSRVIGTARGVGAGLQEVVDNAVEDLSRTMEHVSWTGKIASVSGDALYLNAGAEEGIKKGDRFEVFSIGKEIKDPESGEGIGYEEQLSGLAEVVSVSEKTAQLKVIQKDHPVKVGDKAQLIGK